MMRGRRFQNRITAGRLTLPAAILLSIVCWGISAYLIPHTELPGEGYALWNRFHERCIPAWGERMFSFVLYGLIGYFLIGLNNTFAFIRIRASIQTGIYFLLLSVCPVMHRLQAGDVAALMFVIALYFLFGSYHRSRPAGSLFHAFTFLGIGSLCVPQLTLFAPVFWLGAFSFQSLSFKSFLGSLLGWSLPYWILLGYAYSSVQMNLFYAPFRELGHFHAPGFSYQPWELATAGYLFVLYIVSAIHCLATGYEDKLRTRSYLQFLLLLNFCILLYMGLQPPLFVNLLSILLVVTVIPVGHLFVLTHSRGSNLFFIAMLISLFLLFVFNLWTLL